MLQSRRYDSMQERAVAGAHPKRDWLSIAGQLSAIVGAFAALTYILGVIALWGPIARTYTSGDLISAWYAVSLVPRTVVAGLGVVQILPIPTLAIVFLVASGWVVAFLTRPLEITGTILDVF